MTANLAPVRLDDLHGPLRTVRGSLQARSPLRALESKLLRRPRPTAALAAMLFPRWAEERCQGRLPAFDRRTLEAAQAHLLSWGLLRDGIVDGALERAAGSDLLPLLFEAQALLGLLFPGRDPFWSDYRRVLRQQAASDRWERSNRGPTPFDKRLIRRLGHKAALVRWPSAAVARLLRRPDLLPGIDAAFEELLEAVQLVDDVVDAEEDAKTGQLNAVLAAGRWWPAAEAGDLHASIARGIPIVCAAARVRLRRLSRSPDGIGEFSRWILQGFDEAQRASLERIRRRAAAAILARLLAPAPPVLRLRAR